MTPDESATEKLEIYAEYVQLHGYFLEHQNELLLMYMILTRCLPFEE
jgi:hypothetical protein